MCLRKVHAPTARCRKGRQVSMTIHGSQRHSLSSWLYGKGRSRTVKCATRTFGPGSTSSDITTCWEKPHCKVCNKDFWTRVDLLGHYDLLKYKNKAALVGSTLAISTV
jgi:hypothetical protein